MASILSLEKNKYDYEPQRENMLRQIAVRNYGLIASRCKQRHSVGPVLRKIVRLGTKSQ
jgi:hypothetical protein